MYECATIHKMYAAYTTPPRGNIEHRHVLPTVTRPNPNPNPTPTPCVSPQVVGITDMLISNNSVHGTRYMAGPLATDRVSSPDPYSLYYDARGGTTMAGRSHNLYPSAYPSTYDHGPPPPYEQGDERRTSALPINVGYKDLAAELKSIAVTDVIQCARERESNVTNVRLNTTVTHPDDATYDTVTPTPPLYATSFTREPQLVNTNVHVDAELRIAPVTSRRSGSMFQRVWHKTGTPDGRQRALSSGLKFKRFASCGIEKDDVDRFIANDKRGITLADYVVRAEFPLLSDLYAFGYRDWSYLRREGLRRTHVQTLFDRRTIVLAYRVGLCDFLSMFSVSELGEQKFTVGDISQMYENDIDRHDTTCAVDVLVLRGMSVRDILSIGGGLPEWVQLLGLQRSHMEYKLTSPLMDLSILVNIDDSWCVEGIRVSFGFTEREMQTWFDVCPITL